MFNLKWPIGKYVTVVVGWLEKLWHRDADEFLLKKYGEFKYMAAKLQGANRGNNESYFPVMEQPIYIANQHETETHKWANIHTESTYLPTHGIRRLILPACS